MLVTAVRQVVHHPPLVEAGEVEVLVAVRIAMVADLVIGIVEVVVLVMVKAVAETGVEASDHDPEVGAQIGDTAVAEDIEDFT